MSLLRLAVITFVAMLAFAGNSLLCRLALSDGSIDAATFTFVRLLSGAVMLFALVFCLRRSAAIGGSWWSAGALFVYAAGFSFAYLSLAAATGALLLFGAVQATMIGYGLWSGEKLNGRQIAGAMLAVVGLVVLMLPGLQAPPLFGSILMLVAGLAWGVYSLRGRGMENPTFATAGNFVRAVPMAAILSTLFIREIEAEWSGVAFAIASGSLASGAGYALWYAVLPNFKAVTAATIQLSVPVLAAIGGVLFLAEPITVRLAVASVAILGGVAMFIVSKRGGVGAQQIAAGDV
jgi:drug/metabolite transporter (DMT)-like permease